MKRIALLSLAIAAFACKPAETSAEASSTTEPAATTEESAKPEEASKSDTVLLKTSMGEITIELDREKAPITVENFLSYVKKGHYDGTVFHRVMDGFMIQGGGFVKESSGLVEKTTGKAARRAPPAPAPFPVGAEDDATPFPVDAEDDPGEEASLPVPVPSEDDPDAAPSPVDAEGGGAWASSSSIATMRCAKAMTSAVEAV